MFNDAIQVGLERIQKDPIGYHQNLYQESVRMDRGIVDLVRMKTTTKDMEKEWISDSDGGELNVEPWADYKQTEVRGKPYWADIAWDGFHYDLDFKELDKQGKMENLEAKMNSAMVEFYEAVRTYRILNALKGAAHVSTNVAAGTVWTDNNAKIALNLIDALQQLRANKVKPEQMKNVKIIIPFLAEKWLYTAMEIGGTQQKLINYIKSFLKTDTDPFILYQADIRNHGSYGEAETKLDALGKDALLVVPGTINMPLCTHYSRMTKPGIPMMDMTKRGLKGWTVQSFIGTTLLVTPNYKLFGTDITGTQVYTGNVVKITDVIA